MHRCIVLRSTTTYNVLPGELNNARSREEFRPLANSLISTYLESFTLDLFIKALENQKEIGLEAAGAISFSFLRKSYKEINGKWAWKLTDFFL